MVNFSPFKIHIVCWWEVAWDSWWLTVTRECSVQDPGHTGPLATGEMPATRKISNISLAANQVGKSRLGKKWFLVWDDGLVIIFLFVLDTTTAPQQEKNHWWSWLKLLQKYQQKNVWIGWEKYFTAQSNWSMCSFVMYCHYWDFLCISIYFLHCKLKRLFK